MAELSQVQDQWTVGDVTLSSRLLLGSAGYPSPKCLSDAIEISGTQIVTVGLKRTLSASGDNGFIESIRRHRVHLLPNTAGCRTAREAIQLSMMARELYGTSWIKLEVIGDEYTLQPDPIELIDAARELVKQGFTVFPYCTDDLVTCKRLLDVGCPLLMPWAAPIGSGLGIINPYALRTLRKRLSTTTLIIDAGLGAPSHAAQAMELGFDAVLLNSAVSQAREPVQMAEAFKHAVMAGRCGYRGGVMSAQEFAVASTPVGDQPILLG